MKKLVLSIILGVSMTANAQLIEGAELGFDGFFGASTFGGTFGIGPKLGINFNENIVAGPSFRYQQNWSQLNGLSYNHTIYGAGLFLHARYQNTLFGGLEFEMIKSRNYAENLLNDKIWVPTVFICAGFSREFKKIVRLNVGLYYDVVNSKNSPFRNGYILPIKNAQTGAIQGYVPLIYRISFFFPLYKNVGEKPTIEDAVPEETW